MDKEEFGIWLVIFGIPFIITILLAMWINPLTAIERLLTVIGSIIGYILLFAIELVVMGMVID